MIDTHINPQQLRGSWDEGWALDWFKVPPSRSGGVPPSNAPLTNLGRLIYELKASLNHDAVEPLAEIAASFLARCNFLQTLDAIVPVPNSKTGRPFQPTQELVHRISAKVAVPANLDYLNLISREFDPTLNLRVPRFQVDESLAGQDLLVVDDVYLTGKTLKAAVESIFNQGQARHVYALTLVRKRRTRRSRISTGGDGAIRTLTGFLLAP